jgi:hypothetical protein
MNHERITETLQIIRDGMAGAKKHEVNRDYARAYGHLLGTLDVVEIKLDAWLQYRENHDERA